MQYREQKEIDEIIGNTYNQLSITLENLLLGINTEQYQFTKQEFAEKITKLKRYIDFRLKDLKECGNKEIIAILKELKSINWETPNILDIEAIFIKVKKSFPNRFSYFKVNQLEKGKTKGIKNLSFM